MSCRVEVLLSSDRVFLVQISVDELDSSISVKIGREAVMNINSPGSLFSSAGGIMDTKVFIAGLPNGTNIIKPVSSLIEPSAHSCQAKPGARVMFCAATH